MSQVVLKVHPIPDPPYERCERVRTRPGGEAVRWGCRKRCCTIVAASGIFRLINDSCATHRVLIPEVTDAPAD